MRSLPSRPSSRGVSPVISTILLVAITVVLAAVLYVLVSSVGVSNPPTPISIQFSSNPWSQGKNTASIVSVTGASGISIGAISFVVKAANSEVYFEGTANETKPHNGVNVTVSFVDLDNNNQISVSDQVTIQVTPQSGSGLIEGGVFEMYAQNRQIAIHSL
jgi:flagellin-like protein